MRQTTDGQFEGKAVKGEPIRIYGYQKLERFPVYVVYGLDRSAVVREWRDSLAIFSVSTAITGFALFIVAWIALVRARNEQIAIHRWHEEEAQRADVEAQLRHRSKLEAIGTLSGGIAHHFNNLLPAISGLIEMSLEEIAAERNTPLVRRLKDMYEAVGQARTLTRQILTFSRRDDVELTRLEIDAEVDRALALFAAILPPKISLIRHLACGGEIMADAVQIQQIVLNLGVNAVHAIGGAAGTIEVSLDRVELDQSAVERLPGLRPGLHARLRVRDTGTGMRPEIKERIFDPFFTTKPVGEGTGMGLAVVHGIVVALDGVIRVESEPGIGTTFTVHLPLAAARH
jgi:signal transduction histidine kinase